MSEKNLQRNLSTLDGCLRINYINRKMPKELELCLDLRPEKERKCDVFL